MKDVSFFWAFPVVVLLGAGDTVPNIQGRGDWGPEASGLSCRLTTDKTEYIIGEEVSVLIEVMNNTEEPVALGLEPLIEIKHKNGTTLSRQPAELHMTFSQGSPGFFSTYCVTFPKGIKSEARAVVLKPKEAFSETVQVTPWGPTMSSLPSTAQAGTMALKGSLFQFLTPDLKRAEIPSNVVIISVKAKQE